MYQSNGSRKRKRIANQITTGIVSPPPYVRTVKLLEGGSKWECGLSLFSITRNVELVKDKDKTYFTCDCGGSREKTVQCKHIVSVLLKMCIDQADIAGHREDQKQKLMELFDCFGGMKLEEDTSNDVSMEVHMDPPRKDLEPPFLNSLNDDIIEMN